MYIAVLSDFTFYCHCCHATILSEGTNKSLEGVCLCLSASIRCPLVAIERNQWLSVARASHPRYCIVSVILSSLAWAICMRVAKHSGVLVIGIKFAGSSVKFLRARMAASLSSGALPCRARWQRAVNRLLVMASSWRHGLSCAKFCKA